MVVTSFTTYYIYFLLRFPRREDVDRSNMSRMQKLDSEERHTYVATDSGTADAMVRDKMLGNFMAVQRLELKLDAQVMLIKNMDDTLVNGSIGRVIGFSDGTPYKDESNPEKGVVKKKAGTLYPIVSFSIPGGYLKEVLITPEVFKVELPNGEVQASRSQVRFYSGWVLQILTLVVIAPPHCRVGHVDP